MMDVLAHDKEIPEKLRKLQIEDVSKFNENGLN
jgi:hypothetical protein